MHSGPALELSTLGCLGTHNNTLQILQRTSLGLVPHKVGPTCMFITYEKFEDTKGVIRIGPIAPNWAPRWSCLLLAV